MDFQAACNTSLYQIQSYTAGCLIINQQAYHGSVLVSADHLSLWRPQTLAELTLKDLHSFTTLSADVFLLGVGQHSRFLSPALQAYIVEQCLPLEVMSTMAACHTFHVLTAEQRAVYAALMV